MKRSIAFLIAALLLAPPAFAAEDAVLFKRGQEFARNYQMDFAYMQFRDLVLHYPGSRFREGALFATGEYFYTISNHKEAEKAFLQFLQEYPNARSKIFALSYLYKIAEQKGDLDLLQKYKTELVSAQQIALVFRNAKEYRYRSPLFRQYRAVIKINKITILSDGQILAEISY